MRSWKCAVLSVCGLLLTTIGLAQTTEQPPSATPQPAPPASAPAAADSPGEWSVGSITFSGMIDGYYSLNFNHPESGTNNLRNFDVKANQFSLNMAKVTLEHTAGSSRFPAGPWLWPRVRHDSRRGDRSQRFSQH